MATNMDLSYDIETGNKVPVIVNVIVEIVGWRNALSAKNVIMKAVKTYKKTFKKSFHI